MSRVMLDSLHSTSAEDLLKRSFSPRRMLLAPWLRTEETCVVWAASGIGKTMLSLTIALAVAGGGRVADWDATEACRVLYIDGEMHIQDLKERIELLSAPNMNILNEQQQKVALRNLRLIARQDQEISAPFYDLCDPDTQTALISRIRSEDVQLVIFDNFTTLSNGLEDENAATAFKQVQDLFMRLKRLRVAAILVHHANKGGQAMRGSTALETTFEVILGLKKPSLHRPGQARFVTDFGKFRGKGAGSLLAREWALDESCGWRVSDDQQEDATQDPIYQALKSLRFVNQVEIAKELGIDRSTVHRRLKALVVRGALKKNDDTEAFSQAKQLRSIENDNLATCGFSESLTEADADVFLEDF